MLQQITNGVDEGMGQVRSSDLGLGSCGIGPPDVRWGQLFHAYNSRAGLTALALFADLAEYRHVEELTL